MKNKIQWKILIITSLICLIPTLIGIIFYNKLPDSMAVHFDINNAPNSYANKTFFVFGLPILMIALQIFCCVVSDLEGMNNKYNRKMVIASKIIIPIVTIIMFIVTIAYNLGTNMDIRFWAVLIIGLIFIILGNYLPKTTTESNFQLWVKDKEAQKEAWNKVKRLYGYSMVIIGLLLLISMLINVPTTIAVFVLMIVWIIGLSIYETVEYFKICKNKVNNNKK